MKDYRSKKMSLETLRQDTRRRLGNRMDLEGGFGEIKRLQKRLNSGDLTAAEYNREEYELRQEAIELISLLQAEGEFEIAEELTFELEL